MIYLHKILPWFFSPISLIFFSILFYLIFNKKFFLYSFFLFFLIFSNLFLAQLFFRYLEFPDQLNNIKNVKNVDAVVVLSGNINRVKTSKNIIDEWSDPDRFFAGIDLIKKNKAKKLIFTNSHLPWQKKTRSEGDILKERAIKYGVKEDQIYITSNVQNTIQESFSLNKIIDQNAKIILITSAFHMKRAKFLFEKVGYTVFPFSVDYKTSQNIIFTDYFLPNIEALNLFSIGLRELYGRIYYINLYNFD